MGSDRRQDEAFGEREDQPVHTQHHLRPCFNTRRARRIIPWLQPHDLVWSRNNEAGVTVVYHGGDSVYSSYLRHWGETAEMEAFRQNPFRSLVSHSAIQDQFANLLAHQLFGRFPNLRVCSIETGSDW